jgi:long-chain acyl-CoA synthetase
VLAATGFGEDAALLDLLVEPTERALEGLVFTDTDFCQCPDHLLRAPRGRVVDAAGAAVGAVAASGLAECSSPSLTGPSELAGERRRPTLSHVAGRTAPPDPAALRSVVDILDEAAERYGDAEALALVGDAGTTSWSFRELRRRSELAAWRLRHDLGLRTGDRLLTLSPSAPQLPAVYFGAMRAGVIFVPLDLRMTGEAMQRIAERSGARALAHGSGRDMPGPEDTGLGALPARSIDDLTADGSTPADEDAWRAEVASWPLPARDDPFEIVYTSGTTGRPKGVIVTHGTVLASISGAELIIEPQEHRVVSLLPLSHLLEQFAGLYYALTVGASSLYVRSRNPRVVFEAIRNHRTTTMVVVPQVLELFWGALTREVDKRGRRRAFDTLRSVARRLPYSVRRVLFRSLHAQLGGGLNLFICSGAFLPPALQQGWEDLGVVVMQGYGASETGLATCTTKRDHGIGTVGRSIPPNEVKLASDGEILVRGPAVFPGYWDDPEATKAAFDDDGFYHTGDVGRWDDRGHLVLSGRKKNMIVLPNGLNVFPEDIENALHVAGIRDAVVIETAPGRIEAVVLPGEGPAVPRPAGMQLDAAGSATHADEAPSISPAESARIEAAIKEANRALGISQRVEGWRTWPEADFPRTHTLKVKRDLVRAWIDADSPLKVREGDRG